MIKNFKICISLGNIDKSDISSILAKVDMAEVRIDLLELSEKDIKEIFSQHAGLIATCREGDYNNETRAKLLKTAIKAGAAFIDIEIDADQEWQEEMKNIANEHNCKIIYSYHNFSETPPADKLKSIINSMNKEGADVLKIATQTNTSYDNSILLSLYSCSNNLLTIGMGEKGLITRIAAPFLGAPFTFASYSTKQTAPGQIEYSKMKNILNSLLNTKSNA